MRVALRCKHLDGPAILALGQNRKSAVAIQVRFTPESRPHSDIAACAESARNSRFSAISPYFARRKMVAATPPPDECGSVKLSSSPAMTNERLLFFPSQFGNVVRSI